MIESSVTTTEDWGYDRSPCNDDIGKANDLILCDSDRVLGKCVDPLSRRKRIGEMIESSVTTTEDWGNDRILCHDDRGLGI